jgi:CheY-like chemotaxis protein
MGTSPRVLLVDDDEVMLRSTQRFLQRLGYDVVATTSALHALDEVIAHHRDLAAIVCALEMTELCALDLTECIAAAGIELPTLTMSAVPELADDCHLVKPFTVEQLHCAMWRLGVVPDLAVDVAG